MQTYKAGGGSIWRPRAQAQPPGYQPAKETKAEETCGASLEARLGDDDKGSQLRNDFFSFFFRQQTDSRLESSRNRSLPLLEQQRQRIFGGDFVACVCKYMRDCVSY